MATQNLELVLEKITSILFTERIWFGNSGLTWEDYKNKDGEYNYPQFIDLMYTLLPVPVIIVIRILFERYIAYPIGIWCGISEKIPRKAARNPCLENIYRANRYPDAGKIKELHRLQNMRTEDIDVWFRRRRNQDRPSTMKRFKESLWRGFFYTILFLYGLYTLWNKPWFGNILQCFHNYPKQIVTMDIFWYCILEISFYLSLMCSLLTDVRRHDFYQMVVHHTVVLVLISFSWGLNLVRIGTLFMCLHDVSDIFLEVSKCLIYMKSQIALAVMSVIFAFIWILTRIVVCPYIIIIATRYAVTDHPTLVHLYTFVPLLVVLQVLNVYWTVMLIKYFRSTWDTSNKKVKDARSSDEEESEHED